MVQMNDVKMVYGNTEAAALNGISFTINEGEFVFLVGPSGSGKTTIIKLITGELSPTSGQITVNGFDMQGIKRRKLPKLRRTLGVIFQDFRLIDKMTVYENVAFAMRVVGASNKEIRRRVPQVLELVGLADREKRFPAELSGGEQQRVAIARALVNNPRMIIKLFYLQQPAHDRRGRADRQPRPGAQPGTDAAAGEDQRARHHGPRGDARKGTGRRFFQARHLHRRRKSHQ